MRLGFIGCHGPKESKPTVKQHIQGLDGVRGLAALSVVVTHLHGWLFLQDVGILSPRVAPLLDGRSGVQAFFVLSGFLITLLLIGETARTGTVSLSKFYYRRALRILPLYGIFLLAVTVIYVMDHRLSSVTSLVYAYTYLYNFISHAHYTGFIGHTWSLAVEEHFYMVWPVLFYLFYRAHRRGLAAALLIAIPGSLVLHWALIRSGAFADFFVWRWSFIAGYSIAAGCLLAMAFKSFGRSPAVEKFFSGPVPLVLCAVLCTLPMALMGLSWAVDNILSHYCRGLGFVFLLGWLYRHQQSRAVHLLEWSPLAYCGRISYGIYLYQGLFLGNEPARTAGIFWPPSQGVGLVLLVFVAPLSFHFFERPFIRLKRKYQSGASPARQSTAKNIEMLPLS